MIPQLSSSRWKEQKPPSFASSPSSPSSSRLSPSSPIISSTTTSTSSSSALRYSKRDDSSSSSNSTTGGADLDYALGVQGVQVEEDEADDYFYADFGLRRESNGKKATDDIDIDEQSILEARLQYAEGYVEMMEEQLDDLKTGQYYNTLSKQKQDLIDQLDSKSKALEELQESFHQLELQQTQQDDDNRLEEGKEEEGKEQQRLLENLISVVELQQIWLNQQDQYYYEHEQQQQESKKLASKEQQAIMEEESYDEVQQKTLLLLEDQINDLTTELNQTKSQLLELQEQEQQQQQSAATTAEQQQQNQQQIIIGHEIINNTRSSSENNDSNDDNEIQELKEQNRKLQREMEQALLEQKQLRLNEQTDSRAKQYKFESIIKSKVYELECSLEEKVQEMNDLKFQLDNYNQKEQNWMEQQHELETTIAETAEQVKKEQQASQKYNMDLINSQNRLKKFEDEQSKKLVKLQNELKSYEKKEQSWMTDKRDLETAIKQSRSDIQQEKLESQKYQSDIKKLQYQVQQLEKKLELSSSQMKKKKETTPTTASSSSPTPQKKKKMPKQQDDVGLPSMMKMMTTNHQQSPPPKPQQQQQSRPSSSQPQQPQKKTPEQQPKTFSSSTTTTAEIRNWYLNTKNEICGIVYNHPTLQDGSEITTSRIRQPKLANDYAVVETASGSQYKLGRKSSTAEAIQQQKQESVQKKSQPPSKQQQQQQQDIPQMPSFSNMTNIFFPQSQQKTKKKDDDDSAAGSSSSSSAAVSKEQPQQKQQGSSSSSASPLPKRKQPPRPSFKNIFTEGRLSSQQQHHHQKEEEEKKESSTSSPSPAAAAAAAKNDVVVKNKRKQPPRPSFRNIFNNEGRLSQQQQNKATAQPSQKLPEIRNWYLNEKDEVCGVVHGHQALEDGEVIVSSALSHPELARDFATVETASGSKYRLGRQERRPSIKNKMEEAEAKATPQMQQPSTAESRSHATPSFSNMTNIFFPQNKKQQANSTSGSTTTNPKKDPAVSTTEDKRKQAPRPSFPNLFEGSLSSSQKGGIHHDPRGASSSSLLDDAVDVDTAATSPSPTRKQLPLTGKQLANGKYLFAGPIRSSANGRCQIISAYHRQNIDPDGKTSTPDDDDKLVIVKISDNIDAMEREHSNFKKLWSGQQKGHIVQCHDYFKNTEEESKSYLILERGEEDLKQRRHRLLGSATNDDEDELRAALFAAVKCMDTFHSSRMVWTDLKSENFVVVKDDNNGDESFKAIDLESAVPLKGNPLDYTPEACPPEFAQAFVDGDPHSFVVDWNYDVWSFGMMAYELATRKGYYDNNNSHRIMKRLAGHDVPDLKWDISNNIDNPKLADMISQCLNGDPKKRPNAQQLLRHPYFKANGSNFFGLSF